MKDTLLYLFIILEITEFNQTLMKITNGKSAYFTHFVTFAKN